MVKPLKDLIAEADRFLGQTKTAAPAASDEVSLMADTLSFATQLEERIVGQVQTEPTNAEFEKVAKAINKLAARAELEVMAQTDQFRSAALNQGYTEEQVSEALSKIAAKKVKQNLSTLAALGSLPVGMVDENSLEKQPVKAAGEEKRRLPLTRSLGGAR